MLVRLVRWVFYRPRRLLLTLVISLTAPVLLAGLVMAALKTDGRRPDTLTAGPAGSASDSGTAGTPGSAGSTRSGTTGSLTNTRTSTLTGTDADPSVNRHVYVRVATDFTRAWLTHTPQDTPEAWFARVAPYVTATLATGLRTTDPSRLPATTVAGEPSAVLEGDTLARVSVPLQDGSNVLVTVVSDVTGWLVSDVQPVPRS